MCAVSWLMTKLCGKFVDGETNMKAVNTCMFRIFEADMILNGKHVYCRVPHFHFTESMFLFVCLFVCLFGVFRPTREDFTPMETSPLPV